MNELTIKSYLRIWLERSFGEPHVFYIDVSPGFSAGNVINATFDGVAIDPVTYATSHANTMQLLRRALQDHPAIFKAEVLSSTRIRCTGVLNGHTIIIVGPTVTGGTIPTVGWTLVTTPIAVPVIYADQAAPRPGLPYGVLRLDSIIKLHHDEIRFVNPTTTIAEIGGLRKATVGVHYFGPNCLQEISKAYNSLSKVTINDFLNSGGIAIIDKNGIQNLTAVLETRFEEHAFFDFYISFAENFEDELGAIESARFTSTFVNGVDGPIVEAPVTVGPAS